MVFTPRGHALALLLMLCALTAGSDKEQTAPAQSVARRDFVRDLESWARALTCTDSGCASVGRCSLPRWIPFGLLEGVSLHGVDGNRIHAVPLYHDECAYKVEELRSERSTRENSIKNGKQIIEDLHRARWFEQASLIIVACFESCKSSARCHPDLARPDPRGFNKLSVWRCNNVYEYLVHMQENQVKNDELARKIVRLQIHCRDGKCADDPVDNPSEEARWRRTSLIFLMNGKTQKLR